MADTVYWTNYGDDTIRGAPLAGGGTGDTLYGSAQGVSLAYGLAIDPVAERIYWSNYGDDTIRGAPLAGGGTVSTLYGPAEGVSDPVGLSIDPGAGRVYWSDGGDVGKIKRAPLAGSGTVQPLYDAFYPTAVAIDPAAGRIYWADGLFDGKVRRGLLAGGGIPDTLYDASHGVAGPTSITVDPTAGRIYWINYLTRTILGAPLTGSGTIDTLFDAADGVWSPSRLVIDPAATGTVSVPLSNRFVVADRFVLGGWAGESLTWAQDAFSRFTGRLVESEPSPRIYWCNGGATAANPSPHANTIKSAPLGGGTVDTLYGGSQGVSSPIALAVLKAPVGTAPPSISWSLILDDQPFGGLGYGGSYSGPPDQRLTCSRGTWAPDLLGAFVYRAPQSFAFQWRLNGADIGGANNSTYTPSGPGSYSCRVTASNRAGSASQTSAAVTVTS